MTSLLALLLACTPKGGVTLGGDDSATDSEALDSEAVDSDATDSDALDSEAASYGLAESVERGRFEAHLQALSEIAADNDGDRAAGHAGYAASVDYVVGVLEASGYAVSLAPFFLTDWEVQGAGSLSYGDGAQAAWGEDIYALTYSVGGSVQGAIRAIDLELPPGAQANSSTSGCQASDFSALQAGELALIQRGGCSFAEKAQRAADAGAAAAIIFNEGQSGRQDLFEGTLGEVSALPVFSATYALGLALAGREGELAAMTLEAEVVSVESWNVIARRGPEDASADTSAVMLGAHLDSVDAGAGMNDNASGSAALLAIAEAAAALPLERELAFGFWGAEELGLVGSTAWVRALSSAEQGAILAYLNFDMIASPNGAAFIYDGDGDDTNSQPGPPGSGDIEALFAQRFEGRGFTPRTTTLDGRSDYYAFWEAGVPNGGIFTGAEGAMGRSEAEEWGGEVGEAYDPCYHRQCDDWSNLDLDLGEEVMRAAAHVTERLLIDGLPAREQPEGPPAPWGRELQKRGHDWAW